jgi:hypothetical protein
LFVAFAYADYCGFAQGSAYGLVELLLMRPVFRASISERCLCKYDFLPSPLMIDLLLLQACLPTSGNLPTVAAEPDASECEAAAWKLQVHACALHIVLLELVSVQVGARFLSSV